MNYKSITLLLLLLPFLSISQSEENKNKISFTCFNDLNLNQTIRNDFGGSLESPIILMDNKIYNLTFQIEYERLIKKNIFLYSTTGIMNKDFKSVIVTNERGRGSNIYQYPKRQKYNFLTFGIGLKSYYNLYDLKLFSKVGIQRGRIRHRPNNPAWGGSYGSGTERLSFSYGERLNSFFLGFGLINQIANNLNYKIEADFSRSFNPVIREIQNSKVNTWGLGIGIEYSF